MLGILKIIHVVDRCIRKIHVQGQSTLGEIFQYPDSSSVLTEN